MKPLRPAQLILYADLLQQLQAATFPVGSVRIQKIKDKEYLKANATIGTQRKTLYIGPADDPEAQRKAAAIKEEMGRAKARRQAIGLLHRSGLPGPAPELGRVLEALASAELFRNGLVLVGTAAYQCYAPMVGATLPSASMITQDVDLATASLALSGANDDPSETDEGTGEDSGASLEDILRRADPTFAGLPGLNPGALPWRFRAASGILVEVLAPVRTRTDPAPAPIPALRASGQTLQYLAWLIDSPSPAAALYGSGVLVRVPQPVRYAVHKLILGQRREDGTAKKRKDLDQASALLEALSEFDPFAVEDALEDARSRGKKGWRDPIDRSLQQIGRGDLVAQG